MSRSQIDVVLMGCVGTSAVVLERIAEAANARLAGVITREKSKFNTDFVSLAPAAAQQGVPCFLAEGNDQLAMQRWLERIAPDVVFCIGWSYLLSSAVLSVPRLGFVGYHPAPLPRCRGRHPVIWALAMGLTETASTLFQMDAGIDSGDILSQQAVSITEEDTAQTLYQRLAAVVSDQAQTVLDEMAGGTLQPKRQDHSLATSWRRRHAADGIIDWRMSSTAIHNLVRALSHPYAGADCFFDGSLHKVWDARPVSVEAGDVLAEPGKVLSIDGQRFVIRCGEGALEVSGHELPASFKKSRYLEPRPFRL